MGESNFVTVKLSDKKTSIKIEKGCSFENNGAIYYVDNMGNLNVYDKKTSVWSVGSTININNYQLNTINAIANNETEQENGKDIDGIVLSKNDIKKAIFQHKNSQFTNDLSSLLNGTTYKAQNATRYTDANAVSAYITNGNPETSGTLVFKFGEKDDAVALSEYIKNPKDEEGFFSKVTNKIKSWFVDNKTNVVQINDVQSDDVKSDDVQQIETKPEFSIKSMPDFYQAKLDTVARKTGLSLAELEKEIVRVAENTGYSEYFVTHIVSVESFEKKVRNTKDGTITGGFGRSQHKDTSLEEGDSVSPHQAFDWLEEDIKHFEGVVKKLIIDKQTGQTYGDYYDELPLSLKEGLLDVAFNRNATTLQQNKEYAGLRKNIINGDYVEASVAIRQNFKYTVSQAAKNKFTAGLMGRNVYRFLMAVRDFEPEEKLLAKDLFNTGDNRYYSKTIKILQEKAKLQKVSYDKDIELLENAWESM